MNERGLGVWIPVWGKGYIDMLRRFSLPSLMQPGNLPACGLRDLVVIVATRSGDVPEVVEVVKRLGAETIVVTDEGCGLPQVMSICRAREIRCLVAPPDTVFGDGSVRNLLAYASRKDVIVAGVHLRVSLPAWQRRFPDGFPGASNAELVDLTMELPHQTVDSSWSHRDNSSETGGISLTAIGPRDYTVIHHLPTPYLASFTREDVLYFEMNPFNHWDHMWPSMLVDEGRLRVLGSSELFYAVELTEPHRNNSPVEPGTVHLEAYRHRRPHNMACGSIVAHLRGVR